MDYVVGFAFNKVEKEVILIRKIKPEWQKGLHNGVGGKIEADELPLEAMVREFYEETGLYYRNWQEYVTYKDKGQTLHFFKAFMDEKEFYSVKSMTEETICIHSIYKLSCFSVSNLRWLIPLALDQSLHQDKPIIVFGDFEPHIDPIPHVSFEGDELDG